MTEHNKNAASGSAEKTAAVYDYAPAPTQDSAAVERCAVLTGEENVALRASGKPAPQYRPSLKSLLLSYPVAYLYVCSMFFGFVFAPRNKVYSALLEGVPRAGTKLLFAVVFVLWSLFVLREKERRTGKSLCQSRAVCLESRFLMSCVLLVGLAMALGRCNATNGYELLALHGLAAYWALCRGGALSEGESGPFFALDGLRALVIEPFSGFFNRILDLWHAIFTARQTRKSPIKAKSFWVSAVLIALAVPVLLLAGGLLSEADKAFAALWTALGELFRFQKMPWQVEEIIVKSIWSLPIGAYLYGMVGGGVRRARKPEENRRLRGVIGGALRVAPAGVLTAILAVFAALYALFFYTQAGVLFGAFWGRLPAQYTLSEYARQGFFQLCAVMALNFGLLTAAARLSETPLRRHAGLKTLSLVLMGESLLLAVTAFSKLCLYISFFGFTPLRLLSSWAVLVLSAGVILAAASILKPFKAVQKWLWFAAATFTLLCFY